MAAELGYENIPFVSQQQHLLLEAKLSNSITKNWSNPKAMAFLYKVFIRDPDERRYPKKGKKRKPPKIDMEEVLENRKRIGKMSEQFALKWEKERLVGLGVNRPKIEDCRDNPACGYDFLSSERANKVRYIEVKTAGGTGSKEGFVSSCRGMSTRYLSRRNFVMSIIST